MNETGVLHHCVPCSYCKSLQWRLETTSAAILDFEAGKVRLGESLKEELRCARCLRKASAEAAEKIYRHDLYQMANGMVREDATDDLFLQDAIHNLLAQQPSEADYTGTAPSPSPPAPQRKPLKFKEGRAPRFHDAQEVADWFTWCANNQMVACYGHYQARILHYEVSPDGESITYTFHEFDTLGSVRDRTRPLARVNTDWWASPAGWQPIPVPERHWYSEQFRREMQEKWDSVRRLHEKAQATAMPPRQERQLV